MIGFTESFLVWVASTLIPAWVGLAIITWAARRVQGVYLVAFAFGILFWFFVDTIQGSAVLDVNSGFGGGASQVGEVVLFIAGVILFFWVDRKRDIFSPESAFGKYGVSIPLLAAVAVGIHGLGEGAAFGYTAYVTSSPSLLEAFGGILVGLAYVLHKVLEPMMIGACYSVYTNWNARRGAQWIKDVSLLGFIFAIPSLIGAPIGYFVMGSAMGYLTNLNTTYFFALGTGSAIYAVFRLAGPLFVRSEAGIARKPIVIAASWILGMLAIYVAALFHS